MIYEITYIEKEKGKKQKLAHPVKDRKALLKLRDAKKNLSLLAKLDRVMKSRRKNCYSWPII